MKIRALLFSFLLFTAYAIPTMASEPCIDCHSDETLELERNGKTVSLFINEESYGESVHSGVDCADCHEGLDEEEIPHAEKIKPVDCSNCHGEAASSFVKGVHSKAKNIIGSNAPNCVYCHGKHDIKPVDDKESPVYRMKIPALCGACHRETKEFAPASNVAAPAAIYDYSRSVHGEGLEKKGLVISAICTDCHGSHSVFKHHDEASPVNRKNVADTCGKCHEGMLEKFKKGIHFSKDDPDKKGYPVCVDCHSSHNISHVRGDRFLREAVFQCGACHAKLSESYLETIHGKAHLLGYSKSARCSDCHDPHKTLSVKNPDSMIGTNNRLKTCSKCHSNPGENFTSYLTHTRMGERGEFPALYYSYWFMVWLLAGVFGFFGLHTLLWLPRAIQHISVRKKAEKTGGREFIERFTLSQRITHLFVIISFLLLALTGLTLKFAGAGWTDILSTALGGVPMAGKIHRLAAIVTFGYFSYHLYEAFEKKSRSSLSWWEFLTNKDSMVPNFQDFKDFFATIKWFLWLGPKPEYGRWTYWEKFDYFAVFWGVAIIGTSGLLLWFPEFFTIFLPGWFINVALIVHSEEALLAIGFIFTIHFFNTHLRPEAFPMDTVIFSGRTDAEKYREERQRDYLDLKNSGRLEKESFNEEASEFWMKIYRVIGTVFLSTGIILILLIFYSVIVGH